MDSEESERLITKNQRHKKDETDKALAAEAVEAAEKYALIKSLIEQVAVLAVAIGNGPPQMESAGGKVPSVIETEINNENGVQRQSQPLGSNKQSRKASADSHIKDSKGQESGVSMARVDHDPG